MYFVELIQQIFREMYARKMRTILALFGIVWGTVAVVLLLALGNGFYLASKNSMRGYVEGTLLFNPGVTSKAYKGIPPGQNIHIKAKDIRALKKALPDIKALSPVFYTNKKVSFGKHYVTATIRGTGANYIKISKKQPVPGGRFFDRYDIAQNHAVMFIGPELEKSFFNRHSSLGKQVYLNGIPFTIIGVLPNIPNSGRWYDNTVMIPYTTYISLFGDNDVSQFIVLPRNIAKADQLQSEIIKYFADKFHFNSTDKSAMFVFNMAQVHEFFSWFFFGIQLFLGFCGAMTLGVGGLGVANVMFLIVTERIHEIGLRMAIGARSSHIMLQIMVEAFVIVLFGGLIGFAISGVTILVMQHIALPSWLGIPTFSFTVLFSTLAILTITALLAGYFPARRAAKMEPVTALAF